jgi:HK97 family phage major capsid protein
MKINLKRELNLADLDGDNVKRITISTATPCESFIDGKRVFVVLEHTPEAIDFAWINDGCPIRYLHGGDVVARALEVHLENESLVSENVIWGESNAAQKVKSDVLAKILTNISVEADYNGEDCELRRGLNGFDDTIIVKHWRPLSCAIVVNGADTNCRIEREYAEGEEEKGEEEEKETAEGATAETNNGEADAADDTATAEGETATETADNGKAVEAPSEAVDAEANAEAIQTEADAPEAATDAENANNGEAVEAAPEEGETENKDAEEIKSMARHYGISDDVLQGWLDNKTNIVEVKAQIMRGLNHQSISSNKTEKNKTMKYSITRALKGAKEEMEVSAELAAKCGKQPKGAYIVRDYTSFNSTEGAGLVHTEHDWTKYVPELLSTVVIGEAGATVLDGLVGKSLTIPVATEGASGVWIAEDGTVQGSEPKVGTLTLTAKTCATSVPISHDLLNSGLPQADEIVTDMVYEGLARNIQRAALAGSGEGAEPTGIATAVTPTEWTTTPTYAELVALEGTIPDGVDLARCVYVMRPAMFAKLRTVAVGDHAFAAEFIDGKAYVLNRRALLTSDAPADTVIFGDFAGLYIGNFSPIDVFEDKYSGSNKLQVKIIGSADVGIGVIANRFAVGVIEAEEESSSSAEG